LHQRALIPLFIIWFGIGINSKIAVVFLGAVFAILINTAAGVKNLDPALIKAARSFGASDAQLFRTVVLPGSVPCILTGLRLGLGHALTGVVVAELVAAQAGVGLMMATAGSAKAATSEQMSSFRFTSSSPSSPGLCRQL